MSLDLVKVYRASCNDCGLVFKGDISLPVHFSSTADAWAELDACGWELEDDDKAVYCDDCAYKRYGGDE